MIECFLYRNDLNIDEKVNQYSQMIQQSVQTANQVQMNSG